MITVQASGRKLIKTGEPECMEVLDSNDDGLAYLTDAMMAIAAIVSHAESKYGPMLTDMMLSTMESGAIRKGVDKGRK